MQSLLHFQGVTDGDGGLSGAGTAQAFAPYGDTRRCSSAPVSAPSIDVVTTSDHAEIVAYFRFLYEGQKGYIRLNAGIADEDTSTGIRMLMPGETSRPGDPNTTTWRYLDPERPDLYDAAADEAIKLRAAHGNVFTTRTTFRAKQATKENANPSPIVFVDDAPATPALPWSLYLDTGTGPGQGFYKCDQPTTQADARGVRVALGGDPSGSNENKVLRVPQTFNTKAKHGGRYPVRVAARGPVYTLDQVRAVYPPSHKARERSGASTTPALWGEDKQRLVEYWLQNIEHFLGPDGLPKAITHNPSNQGWRIFGDDEYIAGFRHTSGSYDASLVRYIRAKALLLRGYDDEQIAALVYHAEHPQTLQIKGSAAVWGDLHTFIPELRAEHPHVKLSPHRLRAPADLTRAQPAPAILRAKAPERPRKSRARSDRPQKVAGAEGYLTWLREQVDPQSDTVLLSAHECAARLGVTERTIHRYEKDLRKQGLIERRRFNRNQAGALFILAVDVVTTSVENVVTGEALDPHQDAENANAPVIGGTHPCPCPVSRAAVAEALDHLATRKRVTWQMVRMFLDSKYPALQLAEARLKRLIAEERRARTWRKQLAAIATMPYGKLDRLSKRIEREIEAQSRGERAPRYAWASALVPYVNAEIERRQAMPADRKRTRARQRAACSAAFLALAELRASEPPRPRAAPGTTRVCSSPTTPIAPPAPEYDAGGLVARLRARQAAPAGGAE